MPITHDDVVNLTMLGTAVVEQGNAAMNKLASYRAEETQRTAKAASVAQALVASGHFEAEDQARLTERLSKPDGGLVVLQKIAEEHSANRTMGNTYMPAGASPPESQNGPKETEADRVLLRMMGY